MQEFAILLERLLLTPSRHAKLRLLGEHWRTAGDPGRGWALAVLCGTLELASVKPAAIRELAHMRMDPVLFALSYDYVGDLAETVSLTWPAEPGAHRAPSLEDVIEALRQANRAEGLRLVARLLDTLDSRGRWALLKLVTGGLRIGVSARLARVSLAEYGGVDINEIEEIWHGLSAPYESLFAWLDGDGRKPEPDIRAPFRPVMLAHPLVAKQDRNDPDAVDPARIRPDVFAAEWKYDGIRVQAVSEAGVRRIYTRTGEDISHTFPDILAAMEFEAALDGELLIRGGDGGVAPFNALQQRLNRKTVSRRQMQDRPAFIRAYDLLVEGDEDLRSEAFAKRRTRLETFISRQAGERFDLSPLVPD
ncbi:MAG: cisplatin damage response ATP-dependent DNA ligase, partial [Alphaproteobacteria bacterium]|nr:cisplatin damage response ATP-dependent DNA ligase [Alphaproteobacteria bacterium]